jgi:hypothetical protein
LLVTKPTSTQSDTQPVAAHWTLGDYYLVTLGLLLVGYAIIGKPFAYISIPPLYIGDLVLVLGVVVFLTSGSAVATFATLASLLLGTLCGWVVIRTLPYLGEFGIDALRDSVIVLYGGFAFIVAALLLEEPRRLPLMIGFLRVLGSIVILATPFIILLSTMTGLEWTKAGLLADNLTGAALLMLLGFRRAGVGWCILLFIGMALVSTQNRGSMLAIIIPLAFAMITTGRLRKLAAIVVTAAGLIGLAYMLDFSVPSVTTREISAMQLVENFSSIFGGSEASSNIIGTINWRTEWWETILNYTFDGPYFWTGKGFGINLAEADGFLVGDPSAPLLRSPHNAHFTILARAGVPGLALWLLTIGVWSAVLLVNMVGARIRGNDAWADLFVLIFCYGLAFIIDGTFDVALEGPMAGIWFWSLFGAGIGATMIYRTSLDDISARQVFAQSKLIDPPVDIHA